MSRKGRRVSHANGHESWFVDETAEAVRLELDGGQWVEVKPELSYGEEQHVQAVVATSLGGKDGGQVSLDIDLYHVERLATYIVAWSLTDRQGRPVRPTRDAIRSLRAPQAKVINDALDAHIARMQLGKAPATPTT